MDTENSTHLPRLLRLVLVGAGIASAWVLLSLALGLGSSGARADDGDNGGALGGLLNAVVEGTSETDAATQTVDAVNTVVATAVTNAPLPAPVAAVASPVVGAASSTVAGVAGAVSDAAASGVVAPVVDAVTDVVVRTPIVGELVYGFGVDGTLDTVGESLDDTVAQVAESLGGTAAAIQLPVQPGSPLTPGPSASGGAAAFVTPPAPAVATGLTGEIGAGVQPSAVVPSISQALRVSAVAVVAGVASSPLTTTLFPLGMSMPADAAFAGPGGSGPGAWGLLAFGPLIAYRAWVRRRGPDDERAPAAPLLAPDVSPD